MITVPSDLHEAFRRSPQWHEVLMQALDEADRAQANGEDEVLAICRDAALTAMCRISKSAPRRIRRQFRQVAEALASDWGRPLPTLDGRRLH